MPFLPLAFGGESEPLSVVPELEPARLESSGAVIGEIFIDPQNIFDLSDPKENKALFRLANRLHIKTRERVVRQQLLFSSGDLYSARLLAESERILRGASYIFDASVRPIAYHDGRVDVAVTTRDVWTLNPAVNLGRQGGRNTVGFQLEESNILGTGTSILVSHDSGVDRKSNTIQYKDPHFLGRWLSLDTRYASNSDGTTRGLLLDHPFYSLDSRRAAGFSGLDDDRVESLYDRGKKVDRFRDRERLMTVYTGWSKGLIDGAARRWTLGFTYNDEQFGPAPNAQTTLIPEDRKLVYPWLGFDWVEDDFEKLHNRDQIGRTEDFYLGRRFGVKMGWADKALSSDRDALVASATAGFGLNSGERSTFLFTSSVSGRVEDEGVRNSQLKGTIRYYLEQSPKRLLYATLDGTVGHNLDLDNQILLGGDSGLRGYPLRYQAGNSRALLTVEQRYFTDWYPFRLFRIGGAAFMDVGKTWGESAVGTPSLGVLKDVGFGLRIGNVRSGLGNVIHVDIAFPFDGDSSIKSTQFIVETRQGF